MWRHVLRRVRYLMTKGVPKEPYKLVLVVRTDISMGKGKVGAQCAHAAVECFNQCSKSKLKVDQEYLDAWMSFGQPKIVLKISSEEKLIRLAKNAKKEGLVAALIKDAGRTVVEPGTITVLGIGPGPNSIVDKVTSELQLL